MAKNLYKHVITGLEKPMTEGVYKRLGSVRIKGKTYERGGFVLSGEATDDPDKNTGPVSEEAKNIGKAAAEKAAAEKAAAEKAAAEKAAAEKAAAEKAAAEKAAAEKAAAEKAAKSQGNQSPARR